MRLIDLDKLNFIDKNKNEVQIIHTNLKLDIAHKSYKEGYEEVEQLCKNLIQQIENQSEIGSYIKFYNKGLNNSDFYKLKLEKSYLLDNHEDSLQHYIFELEDSHLKFLSCSCLNLEYDLNGEKLQDLSNSEELPKNIFINCLSFNNKGYFILSWFSENRSFALKVVNSIINEKNKIEDKLFSLCFLYIHNTYVNPNWYDNLNSFEKIELNQLQQFWNETNIFTPQLIKKNRNSIKVENSYFYEEN